MPTAHAALLLAHTTLPPNIHTRQIYSPCGHVQTAALQQHLHVVRTPRRHPGPAIVWKHEALSVNVAMT